MTERRDPPEPGRRIPHVFHFVFGLREQTEPFHLMHYLCLASCLGVNRPDEVVVHLQNEPWGPWWDRIRPQITVRRIEPDAVLSGHRYADDLMASFRYAHLADIARLQILDAEGGIYADMDTLFVEALPEPWLERDFVMGHERSPEPGRGSLCNAWIASAAGAEFGRIWSAALPSAFDGSWSNHSTLLPYTLSVQHPELIHVEPQDAFFSLDWTPQGLADLYLRDVALPRGARSLHLWAHLWWDRERVDFTHFHQGLLTPDYVAHADTTYARLARPHLPDDVPTSLAAYRRQQAGAVRLGWTRKARGSLDRLRGSR